MNFFVGLHQPSDARHFESAFISVNRLAGRVSDFAVNDWIMDSGAFTEIATHGRYRSEPREYAAQVDRWKGCGNMLAAVSQDYMCEPWIVAKTGLSVLEHQKRTIQRYLALLACTGHYIMPVIQGFTRSEYLRHLEMYGGLLKSGAWVGVGSVCKRQGDTTQIRYLLDAIKARRPDLRLHGFGIKTTALRDHAIRELLHSSDSMAWSFAARKQGRDGNSRYEAQLFLESISRLQKNEPDTLCLV